MAAPSSSALLGASSGNGSGAYGASSSSLARQTLRTVGLLVGAAVLFVGLLSLAAFTVASKAVGAKPAAESTSAPTETSAPPAKKLSI